MSRFSGEEMRKNPVRTGIERHRIQGCPALSQRKSRVTTAVSESFSCYQICFKKISAVQLWISSVSDKIRADSAPISSSKIWGFQRCSELNQGVQRFSGNEQRWIRTEAFLNQSWSALICSGTSSRVGFGKKRGFASFTIQSIEINAIVTFAILSSRKLVSE